MIVGSTIRDNDPRMNGRTLVIVRMEQNKYGWPCVIACDSGGREVSIMRSRIHEDGKARRSGFTALPVAREPSHSCPACGHHYEAD